MRNKPAILRYLNNRAIKNAIFSVLCRVEMFRRYLNFYEDGLSFEDVAEDDSIRTIEIFPARDYGISYSADERRDIMKSSAAELEQVRLVFKMARLHDVTILGSSGVTVGNRRGMPLLMGRAKGKMPLNWVVAKPLAAATGDTSATYVNLLGVRKGHRHFAHFFWDTLIPTMVYLRNWHDPAEQVVFLVREDLSPIQRDAYQFVVADHPGITVETLPANRKMVCPNSIYIAYQNRLHGRDNILARDYLLEMRDLFARHYGLVSVPPANRKRIYVSRGNVNLRRIKNEKAILGILALHGFEFHDPGSMPFREQAALFASAEMVVAVHGSGLTNLMFSPLGTRVLEIFPSNFTDDSFIKLSKVMRLDYQYIIGGPGDMRQDFSVDTEKFENALFQLLNR